MTVETDFMAGTSICLGYNQLSLQRCQALAAFVTGCEQCCHHAKARSNIAATSWFDRVDDGLKNLLSIESVTIRNSWDMIYDDGPGDPEEIGSGFESL